MEMKSYIEMAEKKAGKQIELAKYLNVRYTTIGLVKAGKRGLPEALCIKLADFIDVNPLEVIAASNLITEKDEERRKIFESCFSRVANFTVAALLLGVFSMMTPSSANAGQQSLSAKSSAEVFVLCKIIAEKNYAKYVMEFLNSNKGFSSIKNFNLEHLYLLSK